MALSNIKRIWIPRLSSSNCYLLCSFIPMPRIFNIVMSRVMWCRPTEFNNRIGLNKFFFSHFPGWILFSVCWMIKCKVLMVKISRDFSRNLEVIRVHQPCNLFMSTVQYAENFTYLNFCSTFMIQNILSGAGNSRFYYPFEKLLYFRSKVDEPTELRAANELSVLRHLNIWTTFTQHHVAS